MQFHANALVDQLSREVARTCHFEVSLTPPSVRWHYDIFSRLAAHDEVLRPILRRASECLVYGIAEDSRIFRRSSSILHRDKRRHRIDLSGDPISGHELLWNAHGGERGSIVIVTELEVLCGEEIFRHCYTPHICGNTGAGHTPSAMGLARQAIQEPNRVVLLLPRNNGMEWMDVFAAPQIAVQLFQLALRLQKIEG